MDRRAVLTGAIASAVLGTPAIARCREPFRLALTPVFLDNDAIVLDALKTAFDEGMGCDVELVQRRTYEEITNAILGGTVDAAWVCGYPFLQHRRELALQGVPVWRGRPLYQSYLIAGKKDPAQGLEDLRGGIHAFSDPNSNSGYLVTVSDLARMGEHPETFFARTIVTWGHRNVVRAVAGGLARSGSVDGYVWQVLARVEPELAARTRVVTRSEWLGFPPFAARADRHEEPAVFAFRRALLTLHERASGRRALARLFLDRVDAAEPSLYAGIARRMADLG
ncbi:MAG: phosphonate ABC transporter substrate-binding protein [Alphaproteobacteria bacterium]|nr:MAG: phosphonate ABC transporter substrate-binding protein [Alphaproteobacteria bacterium]